MVLKTYLDFALTYYTYFIVFKSESINTKFSLPYINIVSDTTCFLVMECKSYLNYTLKSEKKSYIKVNHIFYLYGVQNTYLKEDTRILIIHQVVSSHNMIRTVKRKMMLGINTSSQTRRIQPQNLISKLPKNVLEIHEKI